MQVYAYICKKLKRRSLDRVCRAMVVWPGSLCFMAGYSPKPLIEKLGIKPDMKVAIIGSPPGFKSALVLPRGLVYAEHGQDFDAVMYFTPSLTTLRAKMRSLRRMLKPNGMLWVCWPKASGPMLSDIKEADIRQLALGLQLVDVKVVAIDNTWSGLKLVIPLAYRAQSKMA